MAGKLMVAGAVALLLLMGAVAWAQTGIMSPEDLALARGALVGAGHTGLVPVMGTYAITGPRGDKTLRYYVTATGPDGLYGAQIRVEGDPRSPRVTVEGVWKKEVGK